MLIKHNYRNRKSKNQAKLLAIVLVMLCRQVFRIIIPITFSASIFVCSEDALTRTINRMKWPYYPKKSFSAAQIPSGLCYFVLAMH